MDPLALSRFLPSDLSPPSLRWLGGAAVAACLMIGLLLALRRRRRRRRETCWFCLRAQPCPWPAVGWTCVHCQQYNGFTEVPYYLEERARAILLGPLLLTRMETTTGRSRRCMQRELQSLDTVEVCVRVCVYAISPG